MDFDHLPDDMRRLILSWCDDPTRCIIRLVCRKWREDVRETLVLMYDGLKDDFLDTLIKNAGRHGTYAFFLYIMKGQRRSGRAACAMAQALFAVNLDFAKDFVAKEEGPLYFATTCWINNSASNLDIESLIFLARHGKEIPVVAHSLRTDIEWLFFYYSIDIGKHYPYLKHLGQKIVLNQWAYKSFKHIPQLGQTIYTSIGEEDVVWFFHNVVDAIDALYLDALGLQGRSAELIRNYVKSDVILDEHKKPMEILMASKWLCY